ncbi:TIGR01459 family HAD-type hydrolase [Jannaschia rubra]|uniref:HAD hydrolase n=1 Tax=Jannaschia rubra TaxID=282197 RepID=A0A0M6XLY0_9RHOB|nr:TIGR01459 family HAD-type hydrolase [Jannaschia rubra]CTQ32200.1 HAD hydrolase [Jannaschia rubra]SFG35228.1 HAD-superfamily class IIA hydrolase, TIGR01459 [Jannaschia rubra]
MQIIDSLSEISDRYRALFVDLWGCAHDGVRAIPGAVEALRAFRATGGRVIFVTNSPRPRAGVARQLVGFGVPEDCYDDIATSGDSARVAMFDGAVGRRVWHLGPAHDAGFFEVPAILSDPLNIERVPLDQAEGIVCTGPFDPQADPSDLRPQLLAAKTRGLKLLCANPDIVVDRGEVREWCAGAIARLYTEMGGESLYFGKPHPPIYDLARRRLHAIEEIPDDAILAMGDGPATDAAGAMGEDLDLLFISGGLGAFETGTVVGGNPDPDRLARYLLETGVEPTYVIGTLR